MSLSGKVSKTFKFLCIFEAAVKNKKKVEANCTSFSAELFGSQSVEMFCFARKTKIWMLTISCRSLDSLFLKNYDFSHAQLCTKYVCASCFKVYLEYTCKTAHCTRTTTYCMCAHTHMITTHTLKLWCQCRNIHQKISQLAMGIDGV